MKRYETEFQIGKIYSNSNKHSFTVLAQKGCYSVTQDLNATFTPFIVAFNISRDTENDLCSWQQGHYFQTIEAAQNYFFKVTKGGNN